MSDIPHTVPALFIASSETGPKEARNSAETTGPLWERYRPRDWDGVIGQPKIVATLRALEARGGLAGRAYFLSGGSGQGKSTIARLIAAGVADEFGTLEVDAGECTVARLRELEAESRCTSLGGKPGRAYIVNEAHGLRKDAIRQLLVALERVPRHVVWAFTTTSENLDGLFEDCADASPLLSRCIRLELARRGIAEAFAGRCKEIAEAEGLGGRPLSDYVRLMKDCRNNLRRCRSWRPARCSPDRCGPDCLPRPAWTRSGVAVAAGRSGANLQ